MNQEEVSALDDNELHQLAVKAVRESGTAAWVDELVLNGLMDGSFSPIINTNHAMMVAAALDMNVCFGDHVVLVSEPAGATSRTVRYEGTIMACRIKAMRRAITLLAADYAQYC